MTTVRNKICNLRRYDVDCLTEQYVPRPLFIQVMHQCRREMHYERDSDRLIVSLLQTMHELNRIDKESAGE
jgi:hypothetical protein